jgi:hypothetical protein
MCDEDGSMEARRSQVRRVGPDAIPEVTAPLERKCSMHRNLVYMRVNSVIGNKVFFLLIPVKVANFEQPL